MSEGERLQKVLARAGYGSRRACEDLISSGRVRVNGQPVELGRRVDISKDKITVSGSPVMLDIEFVHYAVHKPLGVVTTARDPQGRPTVLGLVPKEPRVFPVGRLDLDTAGLLFMTNDGEFAERIAHPRNEVPKVYVAELRWNLSRKQRQSLERGIELDDGLARAESVTMRAESRDRSVVELTVREGRNRLVRRMFETMGIEVASLTRVAIGPVRLGRLKAGAYRDLSRTEVMELLSPASHAGETPAPPA